MTRTALSRCARISITSAVMRHLRTLPIALSVLFLVGVPHVAATSYAGPLQRDFVREEVVRLINGERKLRGKAPVSSTPSWPPRRTTQTFAAQTIRSDSTRVGRSRWPPRTSCRLRHALPLCKSYTVLSVVPYWNYSSTRGEILTLNDQDFSRVRYDYGCPMGSQQTCGKSTFTYAPNTAAQAVRQWMNSSGHRGIILGSYSRVGCGVWQGGTAYYGGYSFPNTRWYACIFGTTGPTSNKDTSAPTVSKVTVDGAPYVAGMTIRSSSTVRFTLTDTGGPYPRVSDWWAYLDGNDSRDRPGFREGAFDSAGTAPTSALASTCRTWPLGRTR